MNYWWVNHKQTFKQELEFGYIWSPVRNSNGSKNQTYTNLTLVNEGDFIFSYAETKIKAIGIVERWCLPAANPFEKGGWSKDGLQVRVGWELLTRPIKPKDYLNTIASLLPKVNSPIQQNGNGNQGCYLAAISNTLGNELMYILEGENPAISSVMDELSKSMSDETEVQRLENSKIPELEKMQLIKARTGQGVFRQRLLKVESGCRVTGLNDPRFLIASHIKPWRISDNKEKIDGNNGLLLSPHVDRLFDKALITFSQSGKILFKDDHIESIAARWGFGTERIGKLNPKQVGYMEYHREALSKR